MSVLNTHKRVDVRKVFLGDDSPTSLSPMVANHKGNTVKWEQGVTSEARAIDRWEAGQGKKASGPRVPTPICDSARSTGMIAASWSTPWRAPCRSEDPGNCRTWYLYAGNRPKSVFETGFLSPIRTISGLAGGTTTAINCLPRRGWTKIEEARHDTQ